ncbi:hypothetical protein HDV06_003742 [Boothiomyces sp. JEL0866]|nr:hypothetical protein HDV06_003742 [Boothiomyces sp. JEL0866]
MNINPNQCIILSIPNELFSISTFVSFTAYQSLRWAFRSALPLRQRLQYSAYIDSIREIVKDSRRDLTPYLILDSDIGDVNSFARLLAKYTQLHQIQHLNIYLMSNETKLELVCLPLSDKKCVSVIETLDHTVQPYHIVYRIMYNLCSNGYLESIKLLIKLGANPGFDDNAALLLCVQNEQWECVDLLLSHPKVDVTVQVARIAVESNNIELAQKLMVKSRNVWIEEFIFICCANGYAQMTKLLLESDMDKSFDGNRSLIVAKSLGHLDIVELLTPYIKL